jgi:DNA-directed RNA polymerase sigma subunit (sigma70/sigma32)
MAKYKRIWEMQDYEPDDITEDELFALLQECERKRSNASRVEPDHCRRLAHILWCRYCAKEITPMDALAEQYGVTRERIRQLEDAGLNRFRLIWAPRLQDSGLINRSSRLGIALLGPEKKSKSL